MGIGQKIDKLLKEKGKTASWLAKEINVAPTTIYSMIQRDSKKADIEVLINIANALNVTSDELLGNKEQEPIETIAAHYDGEDFTEEELEEIEKFKEFVRARRGNQNV
jgi:transcriptional regulator with XRE-family HTH domain